MRSNKTYLIVVLVITFLLLPLFQIPVMASQESAKVPEAVGNILGTLSIIGDFIRREKDVAKRNLLVRRLNRLTHRVNTLTINIANFRESLDDTDFDITRALGRAESLKRNLSEVNDILNTIVSDLNLQDQVEVTELEIRLRGITRSRAGRIRSIERELRIASSGGSVNLQGARDHAEQAHRLAQQLQREIATYLQGLRSNPVR